MMDLKKEGGRRWAAHRAGSVRSAPCGYTHLDDGLEEGGWVGDGQHTEQDQLDLLLMALYSP